MASDAAAASDKKAKLSSPALNRTASGTANGTNNNGTRSTAAVALTPAEYSDTAVSHSDKFKVYSASTGDRANLILHTVLPRKVLELDYLVSTTMRAGFQQSIEFPFAADGTFLPGRQTEPIRSNPCIMSLIPQVKAEVLGLIDNIGALRIMIQLKIPPADDGNNLGVEIQEESQRTHTRANDDTTRDTDHNSTAKMLTRCFCLLLCSVVSCSHQRVV